MDYRRLLLTILVAISIVVYITALGWTYYESLTTEEMPDVKQPVVDIITGFGAVLAMNLGAFLGIKGGRLKLSAAEDNHEKLRFWASLLYIIALVSSSIIWVIEGFDTTNSLPLFEEMFGALIGTLLGALAVALGYKA